MKSEDKKLGLAIIGCGRWGINHVRALNELIGDSLRCVCDSNPETIDKIRSIRPDLPLESRIDDLLARKDINAVIIATPAPTHFEIAKKSLNEGFDVFVEKPMALFSSQAKHLHALATEKQRILMAGHILLYHPAVRKIKSLINEGSVGKLQYIYSNRLNLGAVRKEENILWSFAPHDISVIQYLVDRDPISVTASGGIFLQPGVHDVTLTALEFPDNIHAHIHVSWLHPFKEHRLVVIGDKSMIVFEDSKPDQKLILYPKGFDWVLGEPRKREGDFVVLDYENKEPLKEELLHFCECVRARKQPLTDGQHAVRVLEVLEKAQASLSTGTVPITQPRLNRFGPDVFVHETAQIDDDVLIGAGTKIWHFSHVLPNAQIGRSCTIGQNVSIGNRVKIGDFVKIQNNVSVYEGVELEDYVFCGPSMVFTNITKPRCEFPKRGSSFYEKTLVQYGASIGANATIVCGNTLGRFSFVGAGSVVTKDVPDYALVVGNPARVIGWVCRCGERLSIDGGSCECSACKRQYTYNDNRIISSE